MKWERLEHDDLMHAVEKCKELALPYLNAFKAHAIKYNRSVAAVKKYYYKEGKVNYDNVINIEAFKRPVITEKDLEALFRGLVRLIKEQVECDKNRT